MDLLVGEFTDLLELGLLEDEEEEFLAAACEAPGPLEDAALPPPAEFLALPGLLTVLRLLAALDGVLLVAAAMVVEDFGEVFTAMLQQTYDIVGEEGESDVEDNKRSDSHVVPAFQ